MEDGGRIADFLELTAVENTHALTQMIDDREVVLYEKHRKPFFGAYLTQQF